MSVFDLEKRLNEQMKRLRKNYEGKSAEVVSTWVYPIETTYDVHALIEEGYHKNSIASACIIMIATSAPEAELKVYRKQDGGEEEVKDHWLLDLIKKPNPYHSEYELWELTHTYLNTSGNAYWKIVRDGSSPDSPVTAIYPLRSDLVDVSQDPVTQEVIGYTYRGESGGVQRFEPHQILHIQFPDPLNPGRGLSPLARVMRELGIDNAATDFTKTFFQNAAVPYGILTTEQRIRSDEEAENIRDRFMQWVKGYKGRNRMKPIVLGQGFKYEQLSLNFQEMEFEALRSMTETRICAAFGVDPVLLPSWVGIKHGGKYSNYSEARRHLWQETIIPALKRIESKITSQLLGGTGLVARFDLSRVTALQEDETVKYERANIGFNGNFITMNEARRLAGLPDDDRFGNRYAFEIVGAKGTTSLGKKKVTPYSEMGWNDSN